MTLGNSVQVGSPLYVVGNLCLTNSSSAILQPVIGSPPARTGQKNRLVVGGFLRNDANGNAVGAANPATSRLAEAHISGQCTYKAHDAGNNWQYETCGDGTNVFVDAGQLYPTPPSPVVKAPTVLPLDGATCLDPTNCINLPLLYPRSHPGPTHPCEVVSVFGPGTQPPPAFDNDGIRNNSLATAQNLTPSASYTCKTVAGELSWDNVNKILKVKGPLFIDGSAYVDTGNAVATYSGRATLYLSGTFAIRNATLCAKRAAATVTGTGGIRTEQAVTHCRSPRER